MVNYGISNDVKCNPFLSVSLVHVRALAMTETLKFAEGWNISMDIIVSYV